MITSEKQTEPYSASREFAKLNIKCGNMVYTGFRAHSDNKKKKCVHCGVCQERIEDVLNRAHTATQ